MNLRRLLSCLVVASSVTYAATINFNFEGLSTTSGGGLTSSAQTISGTTLTITRESGGHFDISNLSGASGFPASWGVRTLDPFFDLTGTAFIGNLSSAVSSVSVDMGDAVPSDLDTLLLQAYSGAGATGTLLGSATITCCDTGTGFAFTNLTVTAAGINSIRFIGGSTSFPNSIYVDNITVNTAAAVPEPGSMSLLGLGLVACGWVTRRLRRKS